MYFVKLNTYLHNNRLRLDHHHHRKFHDDEVSPEYVKPLTTEGLFILLSFSISVVHPFFHFLSQLNIEGSYAASFFIFLES